MAELMDAIEARRKSFAVQEKETKKQLEEITKAIEAAVTESSQNKVQLDMHPTAKTLHDLKELYYQVSQLTPGILIVSW